MHSPRSFMSPWLAFSLLSLSLPASLAQVAESKATTPQLVVSPSGKSVVWDGSMQFKATVSGGGAKLGVDWSVGGVPGGNVTLGTISASGLYHAPATPPANATITIGAVSRAEHHASGTTQVTLIEPPPQIAMVAPQKVLPGQFTVTITGTYFTPQCEVRLGNVPLATQFVSKTVLLASGSVARGAKKLALVVYNPGPPARRSKPFPLGIRKPSSAGVQVDPSAASLRAGEELQFYAALTKSTDTPFTWYVNGVLGGNAVVGTIGEDGVYTAPDVPPNPATVTLSAISDTDPPRIGQATVTILTPIPRLAAVFPLAVRPGSFKVTIRGTGFLPGAQVWFAGAPITTTWLSAKKLEAVGVAVRPASRKATVQVVNPAPENLKTAVLEVNVLSDPKTTNYRVSRADAGRFLEQASCGANETTIDRVRELGYQGWLDEQFRAPEAIYSPLTEMMLREPGAVAQQFATHMLSADGQLRQRMVLALGQLFVVSNNKVRDEPGLQLWQQMLSRHAFGNYRTLLGEVTRSPAMGHYLDLGNSEKASADGTSSANENYPREVMQLFSIGTVLLNRDGSIRRDAQGQPLASYDQPNVSELARALTGWGYPRDPATAFRWPTERRFTGPMEPYEPAHDTGAKTLLGGTVIPAGGGVQQDTDAALDNLFHHPNVAPFIATRLIRHFVKSNPSPAYIERVARRFEDDGHGVRGDFKAVLQAVLLDSEARDAQIASDSGKLREPILYFMSLLRALDGQLQPEAMIRPASSREFGQRLLESPSVFNYFSPLNQIEDGTLFGPEFQIYTPVTAVARSNMAFRYLNESYNREIKLNVDQFAALTADPTALVEQVNQTFFYGRISSELRRELIDTISRQTADKGRRTLSALWLALTSGEYLVQH